MIDGQGMMGGQAYERFGTTGQRQTGVEVQQAVATYLAGYYNNPDLQVVEPMASSRISTPGSPRSPRRSTPASY